MMEEYEILTEKLKATLPFEAFPIRELVVKLRDKFPLTLKSNLKIIDVHDSNDISEIMCIAVMENGGRFSCALTPVDIPNSNPLYHAVSDYQRKRIKRIKKFLS